jgi:hypothetical protein
MPPALPGEGSPAAGGTCLTVRGRARAWFGTEPHARVYRSDDQGRRWAVVPCLLGGGATRAHYQDPVDLLTCALGRKPRCRTTSASLFALTAFFTMCPYTMSGALPFRTAGQLGR